MPINSSGFFFHNLSIGVYKYVCALNRMASFITTMFFRILCLCTVIGLFQVQCYVTVPPIYRDAGRALQHYSSEVEHDPVIFSLLNILVHDKRAKAFTTDQAIERALTDVKKHNADDEDVLRTIIYQKKSALKPNQVSKELKQDIQAALDTFFSHPNVDDYQTFSLLSKEGKL